MVPEEEYVHTNHDGYQREHIKNDGSAFSHRFVLSREMECSKSGGSCAEGTSISRCVGVSTLVAVLTADDIRTFAEAGWIVVPGLVAPGVIDSVDDEVDRLITLAPPPDGHGGPHFYWRSPNESPALVGPLYGQRGILAVAGELGGKAASTWRSNRRRWP